MSWLSQSLSRVDGVQLVTAAAGGVIGATATLFVHYVIPKWRQPKLRIEPQLVPNIPAQTQASESAVQFYVRLKIQNTGKSIAKNVRCMVGGFGFPPDADAVNDEEVLDFPWALGAGLILDIPAKTHRFVDLCHTVQVDQQPVSFGLDAQPVPSRFAPMLRLPGLFEFHVVAAADNAETISRTIRVRWGGGLDELTIE